MCPFLDRELVKTGFRFCLLLEPIPKVSCGSQGAEDTLPCWPRPSADVFNDLGHTQGEPEMDLSPQQRSANTTLPHPALCLHLLGGQAQPAQPGEQVQGSTYIFAVFRLGEVDEVIVVHVLGVEQVTVLLLAEIFGVNSIGSEELLVCHAEGLPDGLCDQLGLERRDRVSRAGLLVDDLGPWRLPGPRLWLAQRVSMAQQCLLEGISKISGNIFHCDNDHGELPAFSGQESEMLDLLLCKGQSCPG